MARGIGLSAIVIALVVAWFAHQAPDHSPMAPQEIVWSEAPASDLPENASDLEVPRSASVPASVDETPGASDAPDDGERLDPSPSSGPPAFETLAQAPPGAVPHAEHAKRVRLVRETADFRNVLRRPDASQRVVSLNLFEDLGFPVVFDRVERRDPAGESLVASGRVIGAEGSDVVAVIDGDTLAANLLLGTGELFQVRSAPGGALVVKEIDRKSLGDCANEDHHSQAAFETGGFDAPDAGPVMAGAEAGGGADGGGGEAAAYDPGSTIDVLVVYTAAARAYAGGVAGMQAMIDLNIASINRFYSESGVNEQLRLVGASQVSYSEKSGDSMGLALTDVTNGVVPNVRSLRDQVGADLVTFVVRPNPYRGTAGIAWVPRVDTIAELRLHRLQRHRGRGLRRSHRAGPRAGTQPGQQPRRRDRDPPGRQHGRRRVSHPPLGLRLHRAPGSLPHGHGLRLELWLVPAAGPLLQSRSSATRAAPRAAAAPTRAGC